jgi:imidazole glycerol-phosphate synthase subunit HisH
MITIVDYGRGNLFSLVQAMVKLDLPHEISSEADCVANADRILLPGVGAFGDAMVELKQKDLDKAIQSASKNNVPILGICLGMQILATECEEFGNHRGLDLIPGVVKKLPTQRSNKIRLNRVPNVGWRSLNVRTNNGLIPDDCDMMYFIHSFSIRADNEDDIISTTSFNDIDVTAAVRNGNIVGYQFHPEKSGQAGLELIKKFYQLTPNENT